MTENGLGRGRLATVLKQPDGSTRPMFATDDFATLDKTKLGGGPSGFTIRDLSIDGNKSHSPAGGRGIAVFGYEFLIQDVNIYQCKSDGFYTSWSDAGTTVAYTKSLMESSLSRVKVFDCDGNGFNIKGSHDSTAYACIAARNGIDNFAAGGEAWNWTNCHAWGASRYGWYLQGDNMLVNCQGEGALKAQIFIEWHGARIIGGTVFWPGSANAVGIKIGDETFKPNDCHIEGVTVRGFSSKSGSAIDLTNAGSGLRLTASNTQDSGVAVIGSPRSDSAIDIFTNGSALSGNIYHRHT